ncbi:toprim domain-containing protein, partial [Streptomyces sp. NPDC056728]
MSAILDRFQDVNDQPDGGYVALCPSHADSRPSLRIWFGDNGTVRMACRAGCATGDVVKAAGLRWPDMFNATGTASVVSSKRPDMVGPAEVAKLRVYLDLAADLLHKEESYDASVAVGYAVDRFGMTQDLASRLGLGFDDGSVPGLAFTDEEGRQRNYRSGGYLRHPRLVVPFVGFDGVARGTQGRDVRGGCPVRWMSLVNPDGMRWAAYGVFLAAEDTDTFIVTEGPGDGLTAVAAGYNAVVVPGASRASSPELIAELAAGLKGYRVLIAGDNDTAGDSFAKGLTDGLDAYGVPTCRLSIPDLGPKTDLTDWREANVNDFQSSLDAAVNAAGQTLTQAPVQPAQEAPAAVDTDETGAQVPTSSDVARVVELYYATLKEFGASDVQGAHLLVAFNAGTIKYAPGLGFFTWTGRVWERSDTKVRQMVHFVGRALTAAAKAKTDEKALDAKEDPGEGLRKAAKSFTTRRKIDDLMAELQTVPAVHVSPTDFDRQPDLLSFHNGTVNLRTGRLGPHRKEDLLTYCLAIAYDPDAKCGRWERFLEEI